MIHYDYCWGDNHYRSQKSLFHVASLWEGLNWLLEEVRMNKGGGFRPACGYVFDYHPGIRVIVTLPFVRVCAEVPLLWLACRGNSCSPLSKPCRTYSYPSKLSPFFQPSVPLPQDSVLFSLDATHFAAVSDCPGSQLAQL